MEIRKINDDYFIDSDCNVYSRPRHGVAGGVLKPTIDKWGYKRYKLTVSGKKTTQLAHRLLAHAFIPNPDSKPHINHIDGNKLNNSVENLEWCTDAENNQHAWSTGLQGRRASSGEKYIYLEKQTGRYRVIISRPGGEIRLGRFPTLQEAIKARESYLETL